MPSVMSPTWIGGAPQPRSPRASANGFSPGPQLSPEERKQQEEDRQKKEQAIADANTLNAAEAANKEDRRNRILFGDKAADLLSLSIPNFGAKPPVRPDDVMSGSSGNGFPSSGGSRKGGSSGGGMSASYAPRPQRGITPAFKSNGSAQGNFEAAKNNGGVTPEQEAQAAAYAKSKGWAFDPRTGYSVKPQNAPTSKPSTPTPANQSTDAPAFGKPAQTQAQTQDNWTPGNVKDENGYVVTGNDKQHGVESYDKNGVPQYGFASGADGVPVKDLKGKPFWVGEDGPELARIKDGELTVIPNHAIKAAGVTPPKMRSAVAFADQAKGRGFAEGTGPMLITAPSPDRIVATPATPQSGFPTTTTEQPTEASYTPAFVPVHTPMVPPPGMGRTAFHRFLASPEGAQWSLNAQASDARTNAMFANHQQSANTQTQWQLDDHQSAKTDAETAIADEVDGLRAAHSALGGSFDAITEAALGKLKPKAKAEFFRHAITAQTATKRNKDEIDNAIELATREQQFRREHPTEVTQQDVPNSNYLNQFADGHYTGTVPKASVAKTRPPPADLLKSLGDGYEVATLHDDGSYTIRPKKAAPAPSTKTKIYYKADPSKVHDWDTSFGLPPEGWALPQKPGETASLQQGPAVPTAANNRYFPNYKPIPLGH